MDNKTQNILSAAHMAGGLSTRVFKYISRHLWKREKQEVNPFRNYLKVGRVFGFANRRFLGVRRAAAPYRQAAPVVNGVRMRWAGGKLVPRA